MASIQSNILPIENPFENPDDESDVKLKVGDYTLHLHSWLLSYHSPVFKSMLNGKFKEGITKQIELKDKEPEHIIEMFKYFYPKMIPVSKDCTNIKELLPLCREYQLDWLKNGFQDYLDKHPPTEIEKCVTTLWLTEEFNLKENLKAKVLCSCKDICYEFLKSCTDWTKISIESLLSILIFRAEEGDTEGERFQILSSFPEDWNRISAISKYTIADIRMRNLLPTRIKVNSSSWRHAFGAMENDITEEYDAISNFLRQVCEEIDAVENEKITPPIKKKKIEE